MGRESRVVKNPKRSCYRINLELFDVARLQDEVAVENAICVLEAHLANPAADIEETLGDLLETHYLLEFSLSAINDASFAVVSQQMIQRFPSRLEETYSSSVKNSLLRLNTFLRCLQYPPSLGEPIGIREHHRQVQVSCRVLDALDASISISNASLGPSNKAKLNDTASPCNYRPISLSKPFHEFGVDVPASLHDAQVLASTVLNNLKESMGYYLEVLRNPMLKPLIKESFIPSVHITTSASTSVGVEELSAESSSAPSSMTNTVAWLPGLEHMRDAVDMNNAKGLGKWSVYISKPAASDLRQRCKREPGLFRITMKKIRELSHGPTFWTADNHKRLKGGGKRDVPIYSARLTGDMRLIYQVDCVADHHNGCYKQALKVFGIYTLTQMIDRLWVHLGRTLGEKGAEHRKRCNFRNPPVGGIVHPMTWAKNSDSQLMSINTEQPTLSRQDLGKLQDILILDKYYPFSQALLKSIMGDFELSLLFELSDEENRIIEHQSSCYVIGRSGTGKTTTMMFKMLRVEHLWELYGQGRPKPRQLFVTKSRVLVAKVEEYFLQLRDAHAAGSLSKDEVTAHALQRHREQYGMVDLDDVVNWKVDLPERWEDLRDQHFPLFVTFDELINMLHPPPNGSSCSLSTSRRRKSRHTGIVTYEIFLSQYWPRFPRSLTRLLSPTIAFSEFLGVIKGSEEALASPHRHLDREDYINLGRRRARVHLANRAGAIYDLFEIYSRMKSSRGEYDAADRTHTALRELASQEQKPSWRLIDLLYIDEIQDNLLIDSLVLRSLCGNSRGLLWAGDTAQTVSAESAFNFNDLRAFMHRVEATSGRACSQPVLFQLSTNYRSHAGIVDCAQSIIQWLTFFWPHSIDLLKPERSLANGPRPMFFSTADDVSIDNDFHRLLRSQSEVTATRPRFEIGAKQCILVRHDCARQRLREQVGDVGLVFTVYESKGQEFDDVLLFNFCEDSDVEAARWRVLLNTLSTGLDESAPTFEDKLHDPLCHELKCLYVAITRARKNIWIFDRPERIGPLLRVWEAKRLIDVWTPQHGPMTLAALSSSTDEWLTAAETYFQEKRYQHASYCFSKAGRQLEKRIADAFELRQTARILPDNSGSARSAKFTEAGGQFRELSGQVEVERKDFLVNAAECYQDAREFLHAAEAFFEAEDYAEAAVCYKQAGSYDECMQVLRCYRDQIPAHITEECRTDAARAYLKRESLWKAVCLFDTPEDALSFLETHSFHAEKAQYYESLGRYTEAAQIYLNKLGRPLAAIDMFFREDQKPLSQEQGKTLLQSELWRRFSFGVYPDQNQSDLQTLAELIKKIPQHACSSDDTDELSIFLAIIRQDFDSLTIRGREFIERQNVPMASLCLDHVVYNATSLQSCDASVVMKGLQLFSTYIKLLERMARNRKVTRDPSIHRLFGVTKSPKGGFYLPTSPDAFIYSGLRSRGPNKTKMRAHDPRCQLHMSTEELTTELQSLLAARVYDKITRTIRPSSMSFFSPCIPFAVFGHCNSYHLATSQDQSRCDRGRRHELIDSQDIESYHRQAGIICHRISLYNEHQWAFKKAGSLQSLREMERDAVEELYHAIVPTFLVCKAVPQLKLSPEIKAARGLIAGQLLRHAAYPWKLKSDSRPWLTRAELATLDFFLRWADVKDDTDSLPLFSSCKVEQLLKQWNLEEYGRVVPYLLSVVKGPLGQRVFSLTMLYLIHVVDHQLPVEARALCDLMEYACAGLIFMLRGVAGADMILCHRWMTFLVHWDMKVHCTREKAYIKIFLGTVAAVMARLCKKTEIGHLIFNEQVNALPDIDGVVLQLCNMLFLLGHNLPDQRPAIETILSELPSVPLSARHYGYVQACGWQALYQESLNQINGSTLLHLIPLKQGQPASTSSVFTGMTAQEYKEWRSLKNIFKNEK